MAKLLTGDCRDRLQDLPDNSIDSVVTDPPYGLSKEPDIAEVMKLSLKQLARCLGLRRIRRGAHSTYKESMTSDAESRRTKMQTSKPAAADTLDLQMESTGRDTDYGGTRGDYINVSDYDDMAQAFDDVAAELEVSEDTIEELENEASILSSEVEELKERIAELESAATE